MTSSCQSGCTLPANYLTFTTYDITNSDHMENVIRYASSRLTSASDQGLHAGISNRCLVSLFARWFARTETGVGVKDGVEPGGASDRGTGLRERGFWVTLAALKLRMVDGVESRGAFDQRTAFWRWNRPGIDWRLWFQAWDPIAGARIELRMENWMLFGDAKNVVTAPSDSRIWRQKN